MVTQVNMHDFLKKAMFIQRHKQQKYLVHHRCRLVEGKGWKKGGNSGSDHLVLFRQGFICNRTCTGGGWRKNSR